jgi:Fuc2NAc and GlcNAc transferase
MSYWLFPLITATSFLLTWLFRLYARKIGLMDTPNQRSSHSQVTARGGGISIVLVFIIATLFLAPLENIPSELIYGLCLGGGVVALIGFIDDLRSLSAVIRIAVHVIASIIVLKAIENNIGFSWFDFSNSPNIFFYIISTPAIVWALNLYNFMDGIDAIAGVETIIITLGISFIIFINAGYSAYVELLLILSFSTLGFLIWNWPPAKIFMGDVSSGFLGFILSCLAIITSSLGLINIWSWLIICGTFLVDATITLLQRMLRGDKIFEAHKSHTYQILSRRYTSHKKVVLGLIIVNICWLFPFAMIATMKPEYGTIFTFIALFPLAIFALKTGAGINNT